MLGETFLTTPDLFPARIAGDPFGGRTATFELVGGPYTFAGLDDELLDLLLSRYPSICHTATPEAAGVRTEIFRVAPNEFHQVGGPGWDYTLDVDSTADRVRVAGLKIMAMLDLEPALRGGLWTSESSGASAAGVFENYFRVLVAYRLLALGGLVLHSAGVVSDERAHVFFGRSNAGKTTVSRLGLEAGKRVLSDDLNALVPGPAGFRVHKLPFAGELGRTEPGDRDYPLQALYRLRKAPAHVLADLSPGEALASITVSAPYVNADPERQERVAEVIERLIGQAAVHELSFAPDGGFWALIDNRSVPA